MRLIPFSSRYVGKKPTLLLREAFNPEGTDLIEDPVDLILIERGRWLRKWGSLGRRLVLGGAKMNLGRHDRAPWDNGLWSGATAEQGSRLEVE